MKITFESGKEPKSPAELSEIDRTQLRIAARQYDGDDHEDLAPMFASGAEFVIEAWRVTRDGVPLYDAWVINTDSASFFRPGSADYAGVGIVQFETEAEVPIDAELSAALQQAFDERADL